MDYFYGKLQFKCDYENVITQNYINSIFVKFFVKDMIDSGFSLKQVNNSESCGSNRAYEIKKYILSNEKLNLIHQKDKAIEVFKKSLQNFKNKDKVQIRFQTEIGVATLNQNEWLFLFNEKNFDKKKLDLKNLANFNIQDEVLINNFNFKLTLMITFFFFGFMCLIYFFIKLFKFDIFINK